MIKITRKHHQFLNEPVFINDKDQLVEISKGFKLIRKQYDWSTKVIGEYLGVSGRTIEGWEHGRKVPKTALLLLEYVINDIEYQKYDFQI